MDLMFFLNALLRKKWVIIICTVAGLSAALLFTLTKKNMYTSAATYSTGFTMKQQIKMTSDDGLNIFEIDQRFKNVIETFRSPVVICMLSYDLMLHDLTEKMPFKTLSEKDKTKKEYTNVNLEKAKQILEEKRATKEILKAYDQEENKVYQLILLYQYDNESLLDQLNIDRVSGTDYLNILFKSENPEMSAYVVNTIGREFISFFNSINNTRTVESTGKLDTLAARKKKEIEDKTAALFEYKKKFNSANIADRSTAALTIAQDQQSQLTAEQTKLNGLKADLASVQQQLELLGNVQDAAPVNNAELLRLQQENRDLAVQLQKKSDPAVEAQIAANQKRINQLQPSYTNVSDRADKKKKKEDLEAQKITLQNSIAGENQTIASLTAGVKNYNSLASGGAGADVIVKGMEDEIELLTKQYEQMTTMLQNAENINVAPEINFKQTLRGQPAIKPEHSGRKVIIAIGTLAAFFCSSLWIIIMDFLDQSVRAPSIFNKVVNVKLLSTVNKVDFKNHQVEDYFNIGSENEDKTANELAYIENLRKLRYEIEMSGKKIILFTSTKDKEGKTTIIEALANSFSLSKKRVLLIDANFSNNTLTEKFAAKPMLDQFSVNGEPNSMEKLAAINSRTRISNVDIIGCKETPFSPDELLLKNNLLENLPKITGKYDYILLEGASLNNHADTKELMKYVEAVVSVFSSKSVIRQTDKDSILFLKSQKEKLIGAVLNEVEEDNIDM
ncbi:MAG: Wzz/FepE/Etk N-terminal domain-containing protein [Chitinophagaceae bacterium]